jgi:hypothetical protein
VGVVGKIQNEASPFSLDSQYFFCGNFLIKTFITFYGFLFNPPTIDGFFAQHTQLAKEHEAKRISLALNLMKIAFTF